MGAFERLRDKLMQAFAVLFEQRIVRRLLDESVLEHIFLVGFAANVANELRLFKQSESIGRSCHHARKATSRRVVSWVTKFSRSVASSICAAIDCIKARVAAACASTCALSPSA